MCISMPWYNHAGWLGIKVTYYVHILSEGLFDRLENQLGTMCAYWPLPWGTNYSLTTSDNLPPIDVDVILILQGGVQGGLHLGGDGGAFVVARRPVGHVQLHVQNVLSLQANSACQQLHFKVQPHRVTSGSSSSASKQLDLKVLSTIQSQLRTIKLSLSAIRFQGPSTIQGHARTTKLS